MADNLKFPLLLDHSQDEFIINIQSVSVTINGEGRGGDDGGGGHPKSNNPFEFIGASAELSLPRPTSIDPFRNHTPSLFGGMYLYEWAKLVVTVPVALIRLVLFRLDLAAGYLDTKLIECVVSGHRPVVLDRDCRSVRGDLRDRWRQGVHRAAADR